MAQAVGAISSYNEAIGTGTNREDLSDVLFDVSPTETPFITAVKKGSAEATNHEWVIDKLEEPADNAHIEGDDAAPANTDPRGRLGNQTQIFKKHAVVTGTQERVMKGGGVKSEMAYQVARRMKTMKRDAERAMVGVANPKVVGNNTTAREMGSFQTYMTSDTYLGGATATAPAGNGATAGTGGTNRAFTEAILKAGLELLWNNSGGNENILGITGSKQRGLLSTFTSSSTRNVTTDDRKLVASIDVYDGDFHTVTVTPDRYSLPGSFLLVDPEYASVADLRPISSKDLAVNGDSKRKEIIWETTLEVCNPLAHVQIAGLTP